MIPREKHITYIITINKITIRYDSKIRQYICKAIGGKWGKEVKNSTHSTNNCCDCILNVLYYHYNVPTGNT